MIGIGASALLPAILDNAAGRCPDAKDAALQCSGGAQAWISASSAASAKAMEGGSAVCHLVLAC
jgi:hypothetical protein